MLDADNEPTDVLKAGKSIFKSPLAGTWYAADPNELRDELKGYLAKAATAPEPNAIGLILPHAGYIYSGPTAARAVKALARSYKRVIVIGPSHRVPMSVFSVPRVTHYRTPLGEVPLDTAFIQQLLAHRDLFQSLPAAHQGEHSVQIELPLLQMQLSGFQFVPIVAGQCPLETIRKAAAVLRGLIDGQTLVVASSDFTHYGERFAYVPFTDRVPERLEELDMGAYKAIEALDANAFWTYQHETGATICGTVPIALLLSMLDKGTEVRKIAYTTSGAVTGDWDNSVSYLSAVFSGGWSKTADVPSETRSESLSQADRTVLLTLARRTIAHYLDTGEPPTPRDLGLEISPALKQQRAAFVTLKKGPALRGCIGELTPTQPLYRSVIVHAIHAAVNDYRFRPVTRRELDQLHIEISALTAPVPVGRAEQIRLGTDGVILRKQGRSAVFLPQVAPEQGWDLATTLTQLSLKAGLPGDAWQQGATFEVFQAEVFGEPQA